MKKVIYLTGVFILAVSAALAQKENATIRNANKLYKQNNFDQSIPEYKKAISQAPANPVPLYNLGNAHFRANQLEEATGAYDAVIETNSQKPVREKAFYNKGVAYSKQQKLPESIDAWKNALKLDPADQEARENLQKALAEQKKQQQKEDQKKDKEEKKQDKQQDKEQQKKQQQQPQQQPSKLNKKQVEQLLKALAQKEKEVQQKMQAKNASPTAEDKDW